MDLLKPISGNTKPDKQIGCNTPVRKNPVLLPLLCLYLTEAVGIKHQRIRHLAAAAFFTPIGGPNFIPTLAILDLANVCLTDLLPSRLPLLTVPTAPGLPTSLSRIEGSSAPT